MNQPIPPNLWQGIQLAQVGRKAEALPYLRYAARHEVINVEGWLWLAAASDDREEYRFCVQQALGLDPGHPVARQMRQALDAQEAPSAPWGNASGGHNPYAPTMTPPYPLSGVEATYHPRPSRWRRVIGVLLALAVMGGLAVGAVLLLTSDQVQDAVSDLGASDDQHTLDFSVSEAPSFRFRMTVPRTWLPANNDNPSWRETRDALAESFGLALQGSVWDQVSTPFSAVVRDQVYGRMLPGVRVVETDEARLREAGAVSALTLHEIRAFPATVLAETPDLCERMRAIESEYNVEGGGVAVLAARVVTRAEASDCALVVERTITDPNKIIFPVTRDLAPAAEREIVIAVPVGAERFALWRLTMAEDAYNERRAEVDRLIETLEYIPAE